MNCCVCSKFFLLPLSTSLYNMVSALSYYTGGNPDALTDTAMKSALPASINEKQ